MPRLLFPTLAIAFSFSAHFASAQSQPTAVPAQQPPARAPRAPAPTRDPHTPGYVEAKERPDGENAPPNADGDFILGPTHNPAPEMTVRDNVPHGDVYEFEMQSTDSKIYPG